MFRIPLYGIICMKVAGHRGLERGSKKLRYDHYHGTVWKKDKKNSLLQYRVDFCLDGFTIIYNVRTPPFLYEPSLYLDMNT